MTKDKALYEKVNEIIDLLSITYDIEGNQHCIKPLPIPTAQEAPDTIQPIKEWQAREMWTHQYLDWPQTRDYWKAKGYISE